MRALILRPRLGEIARVPEVSGHVIVVDANDRSVEGAEVTVGRIKGLTDSQGLFLFSNPPSGSVEVVAKKGNYGVSSLRPAGEILTGSYIKIPVCLPEPILTRVEIGVLVAGVGLAIIGMGFKQKYAEVIGEVLVGSAAFTAIYRHSCL